MLHFAENIRKYRILKGLTQEDIANYLNITPQSVSKWERAETYPDITLLPALANILETSIDLLMGMDEIRAAEAKHRIHASATDAMRNGNADEAEQIYRNALLIYPNEPGMVLGAAGVLALKGTTTEAIEMIEKGLLLSDNEKQKATMRAVLCCLYKKNGSLDKAIALASALPHMRESREVIKPIIEKQENGHQLDAQIRLLLLGQ